MRLAAIDVGSNSLHMIVAQCDPDGGLTTLWRMKEMVGLGRNSFPSHRLVNALQVRAVATLRRFVQAAQQRQCEAVVAVATSAVREAINGGDFIQRVKRELKLNVRIISAREEARLIYLAVRHQINLKDQPHLIIDIGGGSVEFIVGNSTQSLMLESRKLGAARMTASFVRSDPISEAEQGRIRAHYEAQLAPLCAQITALRPASTIGTSGTLECIARMCGGEDDKPPVIERDAFFELHAKLIKSDSGDRLKMAGLDDHRRDQIIAAAMLVAELFNRLELKKIDICSAALREGVLLDYLNRSLPALKIRREVPDPRRRSVLDLARRCAWHQAHSEQVTRLCMNLFDSLRPLHGLGNVDRSLIEYAALLHDIGWHISSTQHHKHSMYLILHGDLKGFTPEQVQIMANIARYHRKAKPKRTHPQFAALSAQGQRVVEVGAALLRIADGMDRSHAGVVAKCTCRMREDCVSCLMYSEADAGLELWGAERKVELFEKVFGRKMEFKLVKPNAR